jgi:hypothetical protein
MKIFPYGRSATVPFDMYDATTGQPKTDVALVAGDAKVYDENGLLIGNAATLPTVNASGRWVWAASSAELSRKVAELIVTHAGYMTGGERVETRGDARAQHPEPGQFHSTTPAGAVLTTGLTLTTAPAVVPDATIVAELRSVSGDVLATRAATVVGTALTFTLPLGSAPVGVATVHLFAAPADMPVATLKDATIDTIAVDAAAARAHTEDIDSGAAATIHAALAAVAADVTTALTQLGVVVDQGDDTDSGAAQTLAASLAALSAALGAVATDVTTALTQLGAVIDQGDDVDSGAAQTLHQVLTGIATTLTGALSATLSVAERNALADALLDREGGVLTDMTPRMWMRALFVTASVGGTLTGLDGTTAPNTFTFYAPNATPVFTGTADRFGNRSLVTWNKPVLANAANW